MFSLGNLFVAHFQLAQQNRAVLSATTVDDRKDFRLVFTADQSKVFNARSVIL